MAGGDGGDTFAFRTAAETGKTAATTDVVTDFVPGIDKIDVPLFDANIKAGQSEIQHFTRLDTADYRRRRVRQ
jgi:hypothetical protein